MFKMGKIIEFFQSLGLGYSHPLAGPDLAAQSYQKKNGSIEKLKEHRDFLNRLADEEQKRLESIDTKGSQFIAQVGVIFALLTLFIPIIMDKVSGFHISFKIILIVFSVLASLLYVLSIHNALKNYRISDFEYVRPSASNVLDFKDADVETFVDEEIRDLLMGRVRNIHNNNIKATNLLHAYVSFKYANILTGSLIALFSIAMVLYKPENNVVSIQGPVIIKHLDEVQKTLEKRNQRKDTTVINIKNEIKIPVKL